MNSKSTSLKIIFSKFFFEYWEQIKLLKINIDENIRILNKPKTKVINKVDIIKNSNFNIKLKLE